MVWIMWGGAALVILGMLYSVHAVIYRGRMSNPHTTPAEARTLEPRRSGIRTLGLTDHWPGLVLIALGAAILLFGYLGVPAL